MKFLVTGATSPLGGEVCSQLRRSGHHVTGAVRESQRSVIQKFVNSSLTLDLSSESDIMALDGDFDAVIHIGSLDHGDARDLFAVTGFSCHLLVSRAIQLGIPVFIHVSSMAVYGHVRHDVVSANTPIRHQSPFGISKWAAEAFLSAKSNEIRCVSVRSPAIVGRVSHRHFLSELLKELLLNSPVVSVSNPSFLFNNVVHQSQFAQFLIHLAKSPPPSFVAVPIGSTEPIPLSEIVAMLIEAAKYKGVLRWTQPTTAPFSIDISSAIELGFNPIKTRESIALWMKDVKG